MTKSEQTLKKSLASCALYFLNRPLLILKPRFIPGSLLVNTASSQDLTESITTSEPTFQTRRAAITRGESIISRSVAFLARRQMPQGNRASFRPLTLKHLQETVGLATE